MAAASGCRSVSRSVSRSAEFSAATAFTINYYYYFGSDVVVIGRTAGRPRVRSSSRPYAILSGTRRLESLFTRGVALVIAVDGLTDIIVAAAA